MNIIPKRFIIHESSNKMYGLNVTGMFHMELNSVFQPNEDFLIYQPERRIGKVLDFKYI